MLQKCKGIQAADAQIYSIITIYFSSYPDLGSALSWHFLCSMLLSYWRQLVKKNTTHYTALCRLLN